MPYDMSVVFPHVGGTEEDIQRELNTILQTPQYDIGAESMMYFEDAIRAHDRLLINGIQYTYIMQELPLSECLTIEDGSYLSVHSVRRTT